jgi:hypothetical protein
MGILLPEYSEQQPFRPVWLFVDNPGRVRLSEDCQPLGLRAVVVINKR